MLQLAEVNSDFETQCLSKTWSNISSDEVIQETFCNVVWDSVYCWPPTPPGTLVRKACSEIFEESYPKYAEYLQGYGSRECLKNGTWKQGNQTNYDECAESFQQYLNGIEETNLVVPFVHHMLFFGSIFSLICLGASLAIFYNYRSRCLQCDRVTIYVQLMLSLVLRFVLMLIISEPFVIGHASSYRDVDFLCKVVHVLFLYSSFSSISWMFVQGLFLNVALLTGVVTIDTRYQLTIYFVIGWGVPAGFVGAYVISMILNNHETCWEGYSDMDELWIISCPVIIELVINGLFLLNVLRILLEKVRNSNTRSDSSQLKAAAKATVILFPVLGINYLVLLFNPGGDFNKYFVMLNTFFGSTQGIFVAIVFCFADKEVSAAIRRSIARAKARRIVNLDRGQTFVQRELTPTMQIFTICETNRPENNIVEHSV